ncbi:hypothetical protein ACF0H5_007960 [Mactra antiquata]
MESMSNQPLGKSIDHNMEWSEAAVIQSNSDLDSTAQVSDLDKEYKVCAECKNESVDMEDVDNNMEDELRQANDGAVGESCLADVENAEKAIDNDTESCDIEMDNTVPDEVQFVPTNPFLVEDFKDDQEISLDVENNDYFERGNISTNPFLGGAFDNELRKEIPFDVEASVGFESCNNPYDKFSSFLKEGSNAAADDITERVNNEFPPYYTILPDNKSEQNGIPNTVDTSETLDNNNATSKSEHFDTEHVTFEDKKVSLSQNEEQELDFFEESVQDSKENITDAINALAERIVQDILSSCAESLLESEKVKEGYYDANLPVVDVPNEIPIMQEPANDNFAQNLFDETMDINNDTEDNENVDYLKLIDQERAKSVDSICCINLSASSDEFWSSDPKQLLDLYIDEQIEQLKHKTFDVTERRGSDAQPELVNEINDSTFNDFEDSFENIAKISDQLDQYLHQDTKALTDDTKTDIPVNDLNDDNEGLVPELQNLNKLDEVCFGPNKTENVDLSAAMVEQEVQPVMDVEVDQQIEPFLSTVVDQQIEPILDAALELEIHKVRFNSTTDSEYQMVINPTMSDDEDYHRILAGDLDIESDQYDSLDLVPGSDIEEVIQGSDGEGEKFKCVA